MVKSGQGSCQFFRDGDFTCSGKAGSGSGRWRRIGPSHVDLTANGQSVKCAMKLATSRLMINCGAGVSAFMREQTPSFLTQVLNSAKIIFELLAGTIFVCGAVFALGRASPPSRRRRA